MTISGRVNDSPVLTSAMISGSSLSSADLKGMDIETALMAVNCDRVNCTEKSINGQLEKVRQQNESMGKLTSLIDKFKNISPTTGSEVRYLSQNKQESIDIADFLKSTGIDCSKLEAVKDANGKILEYGIATTKDMDNLTEAATKKIDSMGTTQQLDMLRLQKLSGNLNQAFEVMSNTAKKMQDSRSGIVGNLR